MGRDVLLGVLLVREPAKKKNEPVEEKPHERHERCPRQADLHGLQDVLERRVPFVEAPGREELFCGATAQVERAVRGRRRRGVEEGLRRSPPPPRVGQRLAELQPELLPLPLLELRELQRGLEETRRALERERRERLLRREPCVLSRLLFVACPEPVERQRVGILDVRRLERLGEACVDLLSHAGIEPRRHGDADPVVVGLDRIFASPAVRAREVRRAERLHVAREDRELGPGRPHRELLLQRHPCDREDLEQRARPVVEPRDAREERVVEVQVRGRLPSVELGVPHELVDEERVPLRLLGDPLRYRSGHLPGEHRHELEPFCDRESRDRQDRHVAGQTERRGVLLSRLARSPRRRDEKEPRRGRAEDLRERREAVGVGPLQVVDDDHERALGREVREELPQRVEEERAALLRAPPDAAPCRAPSPARDEGRGTRTRERTPSAARTRCACDGVRVAR